MNDLKERARARTVGRVADNSVETDPLCVELVAEIERLEAAGRSGPEWKHDCEFWAMEGIACSRCNTAPHEPTEQPGDRAQCACGNDRGPLVDGRCLHCRTGDVLGYVVVEERDGSYFTAYDVVLPRANAEGMRDSLSNMHPEGIYTIRPLSVGGGDDLVDDIVKGQAPARDSGPTAYIIGRYHELQDDVSHHLEWEPSNKAVSCEPLYLHQSYWEQEYRRVLGERDEARAALTATEGTT